MSSLARCLPLAALMLLASACSHASSGRAALPASTVVAPARCASDPSSWAVTSGTSQGNVLGVPLMAAVTVDHPPELWVYDLQAGRALWHRPTSASARPEILRDVVVTVIDGALTAFDLRTGAQRFSVTLPEGAFLGAAQLGDRVAFVTSSPTWDPRTRRSTLGVVDARDGSLDVSRTLPGLLGRPHAVADHLWALSDHRDLRTFSVTDGSDVACSTLGDAGVVDWLQVDAHGARFGADYARGLLGRHSADGARLSLPNVGAPGGFGMATSDYLTVPAERSAHGRVGWLSALSTDGTGTTTALGDRMYFTFYRDVIAYRRDGSVAWARNLTSDLVRADATEAGLVIVLDSGEWMALDGHSGGVLLRGAMGSAVASAALDIGDLALPATPAAGDAVEARTALSAMALDPDTRLLPARNLAVDALASLEDPGATADLLAVARAPATPEPLRARTVERLVTRHTGMDALLAALDEHYDFLDRTAAPPLQVIVPPLVAHHERRALPGLTTRLFDPATPAADLELCIRALAAIGGDEAEEALARFRAMYHADSSLADDERTQPALSEALAALAQDREAELRALAAAAAPARSTQGPATPPPAPPPAAVALAAPPKTVTPRAPRATRPAFWALSEAHAPEPLLVPRGAPWWQNQNALFISIERRAPTATPAQVQPAPRPAAPATASQPAAASQPTVTPRAAPTPAASVQSPAPAAAPDAWWVPTAP